MTTNEPSLQKISKVEHTKIAGNQLRGTIGDELRQDTAYFAEDNLQLLKFHGMYQQDDRDLRAQLKKAGKEKHYQMMIRARIPGGVLSPEQYLRFDRLSEEYGNHTLRITTRQTFQLHGILKRNLKETIRSINDVLVTTLGGCGDQVRNTLLCPAPYEDAFHEALRADLLRLVDATSAKTNAYHEIWLDGEKVKFDDGQQVEEPLYGTTYLPRKFKIAVAIEGDNCVDVYANDIGIVAHRSGDQVSGYTLLVGGGMGRTAAKEDTFPRLADPLAFVTPEQLIATVIGIVTIQRDFGNRFDRRYARFKYLLDERGLAWFKGELEARLGRALTPPRELHWEETSDHLGWHCQGHERYYLGIFVQNGRIVDKEGIRLKTALREIVAQYRPTIRMTCGQNILLSGLSAAVRAEVEQKLREAGVALVEEVSNTVRYAMACPAMPTCGLATAESERALPAFLADFERLIGKLGLSAETFSIRMTGCANGCARPYIGDIGFVGRTPGKYDLFIGGDFNGARLNSLYEELVPIDTFLDRLRPILEGFKQERMEQERFGDYCHRVGFAHLRKLEEYSPWTQCYL